VAADGGDTDATVIVFVVEMIQLLGSEN